MVLSNCNTVHFSKGLSPFTVEVRNEAVSVPGNWMLRRKRRELCKVQSVEQEIASKRGLALFCCGGTILHPPTSAGMPF